MKIENIITAIEKIQSGANVPAKWGKTLKTRKGVTDKVEKVTVAHIRKGIDFSNLSSVKEGIANGERGEVQGLPWGEWVKFPVHISHKGNDYARLYPASFTNLVPKVKYFINGHEVSKAEAQALCLASEFPSRDEKPECFTVKAENLISIGE
jgi:hypothetical protein